MNENEQENLDSTNEAEKTENHEAEVELEITDDTSGEDTITIPKSKWTETLAQKDHWRKKAEKVEKSGEVEKKEVKQEATPKADKLSSTDLYALVKADVNEEDVPEVLEYANFKGIPVAEALKSNVIKTLLSEREEERRTSQATNTSKARVAPSSVTGDALLDKAEKGELPSSDTEIEKMISARLDKKGK